MYHFCICCAWCICTTSVYAVCGAYVPPLYMLCIIYRLLVSIASIYSLYLSASWSHQDASILAMAYGLYPSWSHLYLGGRLVQLRLLRLQTHTHKQTHTHTHKHTHTNTHTHKTHADSCRLKAPHASMHDTRLVHATRVCLPARHTSLPVCTPHASRPHTTP